MVLNERNAEAYADEMLRVARPDIADSSYARHTKMGIQIFCGTDLEDAYLRGCEDSTAVLWKRADGDDLPEIDREVIALTDMGKVVFAHRPAESWIGKSIVTGEENTYHPVRYGKGKWNAPDILWWLDVQIPNIY